MTDMKVGAEAFLVSRKWLTKYEKYICMQQFKMDYSEDQILSSMKHKWGEDCPEKHYTERHPGPMMNKRDICEDDPSGMNLYGTGEVKGQARDFVDMYVEQNKTAYQDYTVVNTDLWNFLFERYGGQIIKRFYFKDNQWGNPEVEVKLKAYNVKLINT